MKWLKNGVVGLSVFILTGCAIYQPRPLLTAPRLTPSVAALNTHVDGSGLAELPASWRKHPITVSDGLDETETVLLAVLNSPQLAAARTQMLEAKAMLYNAGLLPDPQLSPSLDYPYHSGPGLIFSETYAIGINLRQILTRGARRDVATEHAKATYLNVRWQEWQIIQQARMLWRRAFIQQQQLGVLHDQFEQAKTTWNSERTALLKGNSTLDKEGLSLAPLMNAQAAIKQTRRQLNMTMHGLHLLLGLDPAVPLKLTWSKDMIPLIRPPLQGEQLKTLLHQISEHRPDLLALQAGYKSQDRKVRLEILDQYPSFNIGLNNARDTGGVWTLGPFVTMNLPILNGNRGQVAMARATRTRLRKVYRYQLTSAYVQASQMARDQKLALAEWHTLRMHLPHLKMIVKRMQQAFTAGDINMLTFTSLRSAYFAQQIRVLGLEQALLEQTVALDTLTGVLLSDKAASSAPVSAVPSH